MICTLAHSLARPIQSPESVADAVKQPNRCAPVRAASYDPEHFGMRQRSDDMLHYPWFMLRTGQYWTAAATIAVPCPKRIVRREAKTTRFLDLISTVRRQRIGVMDNDAPRSKGSLAPEQERTYIASAKEGDEEAFTFLMRHYMPYVYKIAWNVFASYAHPNDCITDITQEVWLQIWNHLPDFEYLGKGSFKGWIGTITKRKAINHVQRCRPADRSADVDMSRIPDTSSYKPREEVREAILQAIYHLDAHSRTAFILHLLFQRNQRDTATLMDKSLGKTNTLIAEAKEKVQKFLLVLGIDQHYLVPGLTITPDNEANNDPPEIDNTGSGDSPKPIPGVLKHVGLWRSFTGCLGKVEEKGQHAVLLQWVLGIPLEETAKVLKLSVDKAADLVIEMTREVQQCLDQKGYSLASYDM